MTQRSRVRFPSGLLSSNKLEQVIYTHGAHGLGGAHSLVSGSR